MVTRALGSLCIALWWMPPAALACLPSSPDAWEQSVGRVKANFDGAQFVVTADVIDVRKTSVRLSADSDFRAQVERATFRVTRAFKGNLRPGDTFRIDSGISACGRGVLHDNWVTFVPGTKSPPASGYPKRWMIYSTRLTGAPGQSGPAWPFEITSSPLSQPAERASYDISVLTSSADKWRGGIRQGRH